MPSKYNGSLTREQFMFREMRMVARMTLEGETPEEIVRHVCEENLFQYPTNGEISSKCRACLRRMQTLAQMPDLLSMLAEGAHTEARQAALIAMMLQNALMAEFMTDVIGEKYRTADFAITRADFNLFFLRLSQEDEGVAGWSDATVKKIKGVIRRCLWEAEYIADVRSEQLLPVCVSEELARALREADLGRFLPAFNRFED